MRERLAIDGGAPVQGGVVSSHGDHRLAMALILLGLAAQGPVTVRDAEIIQESFPEFPQTLRSMGAQVADG